MYRVMTLTGVTNYYGFDYSGIVRYLLSIAPFEFSGKLNLVNAGKKCDYFKTKMLQIISSAQTKQNPYEVNSREWEILKQRLGKIPVGICDEERRRLMYWLTAARSSIRKISNQSKASLITQEKYEAILRELQNEIAIVERTIEIVQQIE